MNNKNEIGRRDAIKGMSVGLALLSTSSLFAASDTSEKNINSVPPDLEDPQSKYPKPPFKSQSQAWPGLCSKMEPRPDHGEKSYRGSGRLAGRKALVTGGDSGMGRAAAIAYAREGADVAINYFPTEEPDAKEVVELIKDAGRKAVAIPGDLREEDFCRKLVELAVQGLGGLDILVNNFVILFVSFNSTFQKLPLHLGRYQYT